MHSLETVCRCLSRCRHVQVAINELEQLCEYGSTVQYIFAKHAGSQMASGSHGKLSHEEASQVITRRWLEMDDAAAEEFAVRVCHVTAVPSTCLLWWQSSSFLGPPDALSLEHL